MDYSIMKNQELLVLYDKLEKEKQPISCELTQELHKRKLLKSYIGTFNSNLLFTKEKERRIKSLFFTYFDGCYGFEPTPGTSNTYTMGICSLEFNENKNCLIVSLRRPGLLIGKKGCVIDDLVKYLNCGIEIREINLNE